MRPESQPLELPLDPRAHALPHEVRLVRDAAMLDPRAHVDPVLVGVRLLVGCVSTAARWFVSVARVRAAERRALAVNAAIANSRALK